MGQQGQICPMRCLVQDEMECNLRVLFSVKLALSSYCECSITKYLHSVVWFSSFIFLTLASSRQTLAVV